MWRIFKNLSGINFYKNHKIDQSDENADKRVIPLQCSSSCNIAKMYYKTVT